VTGSYDKTLRIFPIDEGSSREIYHAQRMQKIFCVKYSSDAHYVFSGSDDTNIRIWKSDASRQIGIVSNQYSLLVALETHSRHCSKHRVRLKRANTHRNSLSDTNTCRRYDAFIASK